MNWALADFKALPEPCHSPHRLFRPFTLSIATKAIYELHRTGGKYALVTMCIGGGQGIAVIFERL